MVDAYGAVHTDIKGCANRGLDIASDLSGETHYAGLVRRDEDCDYYQQEVQGQAMLWADRLSEPVSTNVWVPHE